MNQPIYLDYNATTPLSQVVKAELVRLLQLDSRHLSGRNLTTAQPLSKRRALLTVTTSYTFPREFMRDRLNWGPVRTVSRGQAPLTDACSDVLRRSNQLFTVIVSILRLGSGGHCPIMIPVSHRSTYREELGVSAPVLRENSRGKMQ